MPTEPLKLILDRELAIANAKELLDVSSTTMQEAINYATNVFGRCERTAKNNYDEDVSILALYLHIIEMADGIDVLLRSSCPIPAINLLRSMFEGLLSLEYMLEDEYRNRSLSWLYFHFRKKQYFYKSFNPNTPQGKVFSENLMRDKLLKKIDITSQHKINVKATENIKSLFESEHFNKIEIEFKRTKKNNNGRSPKWYELFDGPQNLQKLAYKLERHGFYDFLYRLWSQVAHAQDFSRFFDANEKEPTIERLRDSKEVKSTVAFTMTFILEATRKILRKFRPEEIQGFSLWYVKSIKENYNLLLYEIDIGSDSKD